MTLKNMSAMLKSAVFLCSLLVASSASAAFQTQGYRFANNFTFYIDTASFVRNGGMATEADAEKWVLWSMKQWLRQTRRAITPVYGGRRAVGVPAPAGWQDNLGDGFSTIFMTNNTTQTGALAETPPWCGANVTCGGKIVNEQDLIVWKASWLAGDLVQPTLASRPPLGLDYGLRMR